MTERLATGIEILDRTLDGGVPPGTLTAINASPASQSEMFLSEVSAARPTLYLTGIRSPDAVEAALATASHDHDTVVVPVDVTTPRADLFALVEALPAGSTLVLDPALVVEARPEGRHWEVLNGIRSRLETTDSAGFVHCLDQGFASRSRAITAHVADAIFELSTERSGDTVEHFLSVPKFRGNSAVTDVAKLDLSAGVEVDISRTIV